MGWVFHHYDNGLSNYGADLAPSDTVDEFPGASTVYLRLAWSYVEPEEGRFNWAVVDTPAQRWIAKGKRIALRFTASETGRDQPLCHARVGTESGREGLLSTTTGRASIRKGLTGSPTIDDPIFLDKLDHFLAAAAARYDGNPEVAFHRHRHARRVGRRPHGSEHAQALRGGDGAAADRSLSQAFPAHPVIVNDDFSLKAGVSSCSAAPANWA